MSETHFDFALPADASKTWGDDFRAMIEAIGDALSPGSAYHVAPNYTAANLGNSAAGDRRHFSTITEAITAAEAASDSAFKVIYVHPGTYAEALTITKSVGIVGVHQAPAFFTGGSLPLLQGGGTAIPAVQISPEAAADVRVLIGNMAIENSHDGSGATIDEAYAIAFDAPDGASYGSYANRLILSGCQVRGLPYGADKWDRLIEINGWTDLIIDGGQVGAYAYSTGSIEKVIQLRGGGDTRKSQVFFKGTQVRQASILPSSVTGYTVDMDTGSLAHAHRTTFAQSMADALNVGSTNTNEHVGFEAASAALMHNIFGVDAVIF